MPFSKKYVEYVNSTAWFIRREAAIEKAEWKCQICGLYNDHLEVHHKTYARLGNERDEDLLVVCAECHKKKEQAKRKAKKSRALTWAEHWLRGYENMPYAEIEQKYNEFVNKKIAQRKGY